MYVLPGNHESADMVAGMCARHGLHDFHERHIQVGRWQVAGLGYSSPTPFHTPGEYSEPQIAERLLRFAELTPLVPGPEDLIGQTAVEVVCHCPVQSRMLQEVALAAGFKHKEK